MNLVLVTAYHLLIVNEYIADCDCVPASCDGTLSMTTGEQFTIIERDSGDGWIQVRAASGDIGYVPSSYIECQFSI